MKLKTPPLPCNVGKRRRIISIMIGGTTKSKGALGLGAVRAVHPETRPEGADQRRTGTGLDLARRHNAATGRRSFGRWRWLRICRK